MDLSKAFDTVRHLTLVDRVKWRKNTLSKLIAAIAYKAISTKFTPRSRMLQVLFFLNAALPPSLDFPNRFNT